MILSLHSTGSVVLTRGLILSMLMEMITGTSKEVVKYAVQGLTDSIWIIEAYQLFLKPLSYSHVMLPNTSLGSYAFVCTLATLG